MMQILLYLFHFIFFWFYQTRSLLTDVTGATDPHYAGSIALALGCIHRRYALFLKKSFCMIFISFIYSLLLFLSRFCFYTPFLLFWKKKIHHCDVACSAGGMALSSLVPSTVNSISSLAKSSMASLQVWALHGLLLTIEAAGLSYVSQVQVLSFYSLL